MVETISQRAGEGNGAEERRRIVAATIQAVATVCLGLLLALGASVLGDRILPEGDLIAGLARDEHYFDFVVLESKAQMLDDAAQRDVWAIGDSSCLFGFVPESFEQATGSSAANLGTFGFVGTEMHAQLLTELFARGGRPRAVVFWVHVTTLGRSDEGNRDTGYPQWLHARLAGTGPGVLGPFADANDRFGGTLRFFAIDHAGWNQPQMGEHVSPSEVRDTLLRNEGWFPTRPMTERYDFPCSQIHPDTYGGLRRIADLCRENDTPLFVYVMPVLEGGPCTTTDLARAEGELVEIMDGAVPVSDLPRTVDWRRMQSPTHFARDAAIETTAELGAWMMEHGLERRGS